MHASYRRLSLAALMVFVCTGVEAAGPDQEREALIEALGAAHETLGGQIAHGKGVAHVTRVHERVVPGKETVTESDNWIVDFIFKGEKTRADRYVSADGARGELDHAHINTGEEKLGYIGGANAFVMVGGEQDDDYRGLGYDFHPETYLRPYRRPLVTRLKAVLDLSERFGSDLLDTGPLRITAEGRADKSGWKNSLSLLLDPNHGFRILDYRWEFQTDEHGSHLSVHYHAEFDPAFSDAYPKRVTRERRTEYRDPNSIMSGDGYEKLEMEIIELDTVSQVADEEFTLAAFNLPDGTRVADYLRDINYGLGAPDDELTLAQLLDGPLSGDASLQVQADSEAQQARDTEPAGAAPVPAAAQPQPGSRTWIALLGAILTCVALAVLVLLLRRRQRDKKLPGGS